MNELVAELTEIIDRLLAAADAATAEYNAWMWERADDEAITDVVDDIVSIHGMSRTEAEGIVDALVAALIGPKKEVTSDN